MKEKEFMNLQKHNRRVIISGGGTGGHIFPAISIANALLKADPDIDILFVGAEGKMEMEKVPAAGYRIIGLPVAGISRTNILRNFSVLFRLIKSLRLAKKTIREFKPDVAVGVGGYASGPVLRQAAKMGIPILLQEQNSYAGVTNRLLAKKASVVCVAWDGMEKYFPPGRIIKTGNPVRQNFEDLSDLHEEALKYFGLRNEMPVILVLGGSLGAGSINRCISDNIKTISESQCQWIWQTGKNYYDDIKKTIPDSSGGKISVQAFIDRMDMAFAASDIIVSRAGAGTISELCLAGKPVILVPSPNVAEDHQTKNAMALSEKEAAIMIPDEKAIKLLVDEALKLVSDIVKRRTLSENIARMAERDADVRIAGEVIKLTGK